MNEQTSKSEFMQDLGKAKEELKEAFGETEAAKAARVAAAKVRRTRSIMTFSGKRSQSWHHNTPNASASLVLVGRGSDK